MRRCPVLADEDPRLPALDAKRWTLGVALSQRPWSFVASIAMAAAFVCNGLTPVVVGQAVDEAIATSSLQRLGFWIVVLAGLYLVAIGVNWVARFMLVRSQQLVSHDLRTHGHRSDPGSARVRRSRAHPRRSAADRLRRHPTGGRDRDDDGHAGRGGGLDHLRRDRDVHHQPLAQSRDPRRRASPRGRRLACRPSRCSADRSPVSRPSPRLPPPLRMWFRDCASSRDWARSSPSEVATTKSPGSRTTRRSRPTRPRHVSTASPMPPVRSSSRVLASPPVCSLSTGS